MVSSTQSDRGIDIRAEVMASPAYRERMELLFELFKVSRQSDRNPESLLAFQAGLAEILKGWQEKKQEFKREDNRLGIAVVNRLILVLKQIADSIAWRVLGYDRLLIQLLAEHSKTGFFDETIFADFEIASQIIKNSGAAVLVNDLTTILRHGDLTVIHPNKHIEIAENKTGEGSRRSGRTSRQKKKLVELLHFLNTGARISTDNTQDYIIRVDIPIQTHHAAVADVVTQARQRGYQRMIVTNCFAVEAVWMEHPAAHLPEKRPFESVEHTFSHGSLDVFDKPTPRVAPYGIFPFDDRTCFDLITGSLQIITTLNFDALVKLFAQSGLTLKLPQPSQQEIERFLSASIAERGQARTQMQDRNVWCAINDDGYSLKISPDYWYRISHEFMHEKTFAETRLVMMKQISNLEIPEGRVTRFYVGYMDESGIWS